MYQAFNVALTAWYIRGVLAVPAFWLASRMPFASNRLARPIVVHLVASIVYAVAVQAAFTEILRRLPSTRQVLPSPAEAQVSLVVYWIVLGVAHAVRYYSQVRDGEVAAAKLQTQLASARLDVLRGQLHPHFLFNTLNDIAELIHEDPERADEMLTTVSELLRASLARTDQRDVTLDDELAFLERYLEVARMRFRDQLTIEVDVPASLRGTLVPSLILQPVVENAIRHGIARRDGDGRVRISAVRDGTTLRLEVSDNGPGLDDAASEGVGLRTTRQRLREQFADAASFDLKAGDNGGAVARISLPVGAA
jgi:two-component system, LytTR family, sensor kinase